MTSVNPPPTAQDLIEPGGMVALETLLEELRLTKADLARTLGMSRNAFYARSRLSSPTTQSELREFLEVLVSVASWAGSIPQAFAWFTSQPLPSFGDQTAAALFREGRTEALRTYIDRVSSGGYA